MIDAFNADLPYDRFLHEQLAGDILAADGPPDDYARRVIATGFVAQAKRFGTRKLEDIHQIIEDTLNTTGQVVLGLSLRCARCHDHKYDPITARDYYALYGFFAGTKYPFAGAEEDRRPSEFAPLVPPDRIKDYEAKHAEASPGSRRSSPRPRPAARPGGCATWGWRPPWPSSSPRRRADRAAAARGVELAKVELAKAVRKRDGQLKQLRGEIKRLEEAGPLARPRWPTPSATATPTDAKLQIGGDPRKLGAVVPRGVPKVPRARPAPIDLPARGERPARAGPLADRGPAAALAARVMVNRIWQHHFGKPIVPTPSDFGLRGTPPTHPELLEWLAADFIASGWSIKAMHRRIMLSKTYQLASEHDSADAAIDTGNAWYWRFDRRPLDAEALRDSLLDLGGQPRLDPGPGPHPFPPPEHLDVHGTPPVQGGLPVGAPERLPDGPAPPPAPVPRPLQRARHERDDRRARRLDRPAPGPLPAEQPVRPRPGAAVRRPADRRRARPAGEAPPRPTSGPSAGRRRGDERGRALGLPRAIRAEPGRRGRARRPPGGRGLGRPGPGAARLERVPLRGLIARIDRQCDRGFHDMAARHDLNRRIPAPPCLGLRRGRAGWGSIAGSRSPPRRTAGTRSRPGPATSRPGPST